MLNKIKLVQIAYKSEWALARFFEALKNPDISSKFFLETICGREASDTDAVDALTKRITEIKKAIEAKEWRAEQRNKEMENANYLISLLASKKIKYCQVRKDTRLPQAVYDHDFGKALVVHSLNITHTNYIRDGLLHKANILCEKPLTTVVDIEGNPDDSSIRSLETIVRNLKGDLVLMDAEHYSYKKPSLIFYEKLEQLLADKNGNIRKIKKVEGEIMEIDKPDWKRTREILSFERNQTGLLGDTMCHLLAFISNLGGRAIPEERTFDCYPGFDADTLNNVKYKIINSDLLKNYFAQNATADLRVAKFIDKIKGTKKDVKESKFIKFILEDNSSITLDFKQGTLTKDGKDCSYFRYAVSGNEYVNILNIFHEAIEDKRKPLTDYRSSMDTLQSTFETYALPEEKNRRIRVYKTK
jgi:predicted dehydrogenase